MAEKTWRKKFEFRFRPIPRKSHINMTWIWTGFGFPLSNWFHHELQAKFNETTLEIINPSVTAFSILFIGDIYDGFRTGQFEGFIPQGSHRPFIHRSTTCLQNGLRSASQQTRWRHLFSSNNWSLAQSIDCPRGYLERNKQRSIKYSPNLTSMKTYCRINPSGRKHRRFRVEKHSFKTAYFVMSKRRWISCLIYFAVIFSG